MTDPSPEQPKLTPANQNPWYILMTLHGEQPEGAGARNFNNELHAKNRRDWNKWAARGLSAERRDELLAMTDSGGAPRFSEDELTPHTDDEFAALAAAFEEASRQRGAAAALLSPGEVCDFEKVAFDRAFIAQGLLFPGVVTFSGSTFSGDANLSGSTFSGDADLAGATFSGDADLAGATFSGNADLAGATFSGDAKFVGANFSRSFVLSNATFTSDADLTGATFDREANLSGVMFLQGASLSGAVFSGAANLSGAAFMGDANLSGATFSGDANLTRATFFNEKAHLSKIIFSQTADLSRAKFFAPAELSKTKFRGVACLESVIFENDANLSGVKFCKDAKLSRIQFCHDSDLSNSAFSGEGDLSRATFRGFTNFSNATFKSLISFAEANFATFPPNFHEATLHIDMDWVGAQWPPAPDNIDDAKRHVRYYQRLKQIMEGLKTHEDELKFFAMEMAAQRVVDGGWRTPRGILNGLYGAVSDYGRSISLPSQWLIIVVGLGFIFLAGVHECKDIGGASTCAAIPPRNALGLALTSAISFLPLKKEIFPSIETLPWAAHTVMGVTTVLSFALLFLIGLALRNRFRMK